MTRKQRAEELCSRINARIGWSGANPEFGLVNIRRSEGGYTGNVVLSPRAADEVARLLEKKGLQT